jgi:WD40 repeat protein/class 3 adenylate cyclase
MAMLVFFFTDIEGSTRLWEEHTDEMGAVIVRHDAILQQQISQSGGQFTKHTGDGVFAVFEGGQPLTCALEAQVQFAAVDWGAIGELRIRIGLHAGEAELLHAGDYFGPAVNCTARVMSAGWGGQILFTPEVSSVSPLPTQAALRDLGQHLLKDVSAAQQIYQLLHPELSVQEFPPLRTLSSNSIQRTIEQEGQRLVALPPSAIAIGLVSATLLPTLLGDVSPSSPALEGNLGVLGDLGAGALRDWMAGFAERLRGRQETGEAVTELAMREQLEMELLEQWQAGGDVAAALRADASRLLQAVHGVGAALEAATAEVRDALARGLADLGGRFDEFGWMLSGVQETLAEMRARQAMQFALQREQLDLQREQLVKTNLLLRYQQERAAVSVPGVPAVAAEEGEDLAPADVPCPYKGLAAFEPEDAAYFFGREELVAELTARLAGTPFLAVVGPSGSGKSSVVRAGLLPAIWQDALPDSKDWQTLVLTPGQHPLEELALRISLLNGFTAAALLDDLESHARGLDMAVKQVLSAQPHHARLLLVVDQFEEIFALCRDERERRIFIDALLYAVEAEDSRTVVVPTIRADFYGRCADYPNLAARLQDNVLVGPLTEHELRQVIERPAALVGLRLEPGLVDTVTGDVADEPGALPLLSHALLETWERRRGHTLTLAGYAESGGVAGAIAQTADMVFQQFTQEQQGIARSIFLRLTELGEEGTQDTRRRAPPNELVGRVEDAPAVETVVKTLADARLITTGEDTVEVAHEALIREWPALRGWLEEDREGLRTHRRLTEAAQEWERLNREPSELYRGARLATTSEWAEQHADQLNPLEREFLEASQELAQRREREREAQRQRELETAQKLAEAEGKRAEEQARATSVFRRLAAVLAGVFLVAVAAAVFAVVQQQRAERQARVATSRELAAAAINSLEVDPERSVLLALEAVSVTRSVDGTVTRDAEQALHEVVPASRVRLRLTGHGGPVSFVEFSPDGTKLATTSQDGTAKLWNVEPAATGNTGRELLTLEGHTDAVFGVDFSQDGARLATSSFDGRTIVWDLEASLAAGSGRKLLTVGGAGRGVSVRFSPDEKRLITHNQDDGTVQVWDAVSGKELLSFVAHHAPSWSVAVSPDGTRLATASMDGTAKVWDLEASMAASSGQLLHTLSAQVGGVSRVAFGPDGTWLVTAHGDGTARIWDSDTGQELLALPGHTARVIQIAVSADATRLATGGVDGIVNVWDMTALSVQESAAAVTFGTTPLTLRGHVGIVIGLSFSPDGMSLATGSFDGTVRVWDLSPERELVTLAQHQAGVLGVAFSPDGTRLASASHDGTVMVWDLEASLSSPSGIAMLTLPDGDRSTQMNAVAFSPDGKRLVSASGDATAALWDIASGERLLTLLGHGPGQEATQVDGVTAAEFSPDGARVATAGADGTARIWDTSTGQELLTLVGHGRWRPGQPSHDGVVAVAFSPDGELVATAGVDGTTRLWDAGSGQELLTWDSHPDNIVLDVAFSPDGTRLATGGYEGTAKIWNLDASGSSIAPRLLITLTGHASGVFGVAFSPDGASLVTGSEDGTAKVWNLEATAGPAMSPQGGSARELFTLAGHSAGVADVAMSPDGKVLATSSWDGTVRLHVLPIEELVRLARTRVTRSLTDEECQQYLHVEECPPAP